LEPSTHADRVPIPSIPARAIGGARDLSRELTALKQRPDLPWLRDVDSQVLQQGLLDLHRSFESFFARRSGFPRFRSRKSSRATFRYPQRVKVAERRVFLPKVGWVRMRRSKDLGDYTGGATVRQDPDGYWFVSLTVAVPAPPPRCSDPGRPVGIDLGVKTLATLSDGRRVTNPRWLAGDARRLRRAHRALSRKDRGSRNRDRARRRLARVHRRVANRRRDFLHKLTSELTRTHDHIGLEDLGLRGMARTKLARRLNDASLREVRRQLTYKCETAGVSLVVVDRFFASTRICSECGERNEDLRLVDRTWRCCCGAAHDRDLNAARNILAESLRLARGRGARGHENARGARVGPRFEAVGIEAGTP
jgi:putative transposase